MKHKNGHLLLVLLTMKYMLTSKHGTGRLSQGLNLGSSTVLGSTSVFIGISVDTQTVKVWQRLESISSMFYEQIL
jgi:hypothetical protein